MAFSESFGEDLHKSLANLLRKEFKFLSSEALQDMSEYCKRMVLSEQIREFATKRLREEYPWLKQAVLEGVARQCTELICKTLLSEAPQMEASQANANLLSLPPEIRNRICALVVTPQDDSHCTRGPNGTRVIELADYYSPSESDSNTMELTNYHAGNEEWAIQPPLTRVCKQLREETLAMYYANTFLVVVWDHGYHYRDFGGKKYLNLNASAIEQWLTSIGAKNRALIKSFIVLHGARNRTRISADRFAGVLKDAGFALDHCVFRSYRKDFSVWHEVKKEEDSVDESAIVKWNLSMSQRYWR